MEHEIPKNLKHVHFEPDRNGNPRYYFRKGKGIRIRLPDDPKCPSFIASVKAAARSKNLKALPPLYSPKPSASNNRDVEFRKIASRLMSKAKSRAKAKSLEFDLSTDWIFKQIENSQFRCPMCKIPYTLDKHEETFMNPFVPSLDKIDPRKGYTFSNVRVIAFIVNSMMSDWGEDLMIQVANGVRLSRSNRIKSQSLSPNPVSSEGEIQ